DRDAFVDQRRSADQLLACDDDVIGGMQPDRQRGLLQHVASLKNPSRVRDAFSLREHSSATLSRAALWCCDSCPPRRETPRPRRPADTAPTKAAARRRAAMTGRTP